MDINKAAHERIGILARNITGKEHLTKDEFEELYKFCKDQKLDARVRCDALLSVAKVLTVHLPDYAVGKHSAKDNISRDIRERREYEKVLLDFTRRFILYCEYVACGRDNSTWARAGACKTLSILFREKHRFNTSDTLAKTIVRLARLPVPQYRKHLCNAIKGVFDNDPHGEYTLKIMQKVAETPTPKISVGLHSRRRTFRNQVARRTSRSSRTKSSSAS